MDRILPILLEAHIVVCQDDRSDLVEVKIGDQLCKIPSIEACYYNYLNTGHHIKVACHGDEIIGLLVYRSVFDQFISVRLLYVREANRDSGVGKGLFGAIPKFEKAIFQTFRVNPPQELFENLDNRVLVMEDEKLCTWIAGGMRREDGPKSVCPA